MGSDAPKDQQPKRISQNSKQTNKDQNCLLESISGPQHENMTKINKLGVWMHFTVTKNDAREAICKSGKLIKIERRLKNFTMIGLDHHLRTWRPEQNYKNSIFFISVSS